MAFSGHVAVPIFKMGLAIEGFNKVAGQSSDPIKSSHSTVSEGQNAREFFPGPTSSSEQLSNSAHAIDIISMS